MVFENQDSGIEQFFSKGEVMTITLNSGKNILRDFETQSTMDQDRLQTKMIVPRYYRNDNGDHSWPVQVFAGGEFLGYISRDSLHLIIGNDGHSRFLNWENQIPVWAGCGA
jgi:hypothetical protein